MTSIVTSTLLAKSGQWWVTAIVQCLSSLPDVALKCAWIARVVSGVVQGWHGSVGIVVSGGGSLLSQLAPHRVKVLVMRLRLFIPVWRVFRLLLPIALLAECLRIIFLVGRFCIVAAVKYKTN